MSIWKLTKIEFLKYFHTLSFLFFSICITICYMVPIILFQFLQFELNPILTYNEVLQFNSYLTLPFITLFHYSSFLSKEYSNDTIKILNLSIFSKEEIFFSKYLTASITLILLFIPANVLCSIYIFANYGPTVTIQYGYETVIMQWYEALIQIMGVQILLLIYLMTLGAITMLVNVIVKKRMVTIVVALSIVILTKVIHIPPELINFTFIEGYSVINSLTDPGRSILTSLQIAVSSLAFILLFCSIASYLFKQQHYS